MLLRYAVDGDDPTARYRSRVVADGGTVSNYGDVQKIVQMLKTSGRFKNVKLLWYGGAGVKLRTSGVNSFVSKAYSVQLPANDLAQTTELSQPWQSGNIAPNEKPCLLNPNGGDRFLSHPTISFGANEAWSLTIMLNHNHTINTDTTPIFAGKYALCGVGIAIASSRNKYSIINSDGTSVGGLNDKFNKGFGKVVVLQYVAEGNGNVKIYYNGVLDDTITIQSNIIFENLMRGRYGYVRGKVYYYCIQSGALTASQVAAENNTLRALIAEVETVLIGNKYIASSNFDVVCSANGTVIADGTLTANWTPGTAAWCYPKDATPSDVYLGGKLYNKAARNVIIANPPAGYHVATEAELTALAALGGNALKYAGTDYWATTGGTNTTGFTALGMASRKADGSFNTYKNTASFWCADSDKVLVLSHDSNTASVEAVASVNDGYSIRLIKD